MKKILILVIIVLVALLVFTNVNKKNTNENQVGVSQQNSGSEAEINNIDPNMKEYIVEDFSIIMSKNFQKGDNLVKNDGTVLYRFFGNNIPIGITINNGQYSYVSLVDDPSTTVYEPDYDSVPVIKKIGDNNIYVAYSSDGAPSVSYIINFPEKNKYINITSEGIEDIEKYIDFANIKFVD